MPNSNQEIESKFPHKSKDLLATEQKILQARDQIIGLTAQLAESDHLLQIARKNNKTLREELKSISSSATWKFGRILMFPFRVSQRVFSKVK